MRQGQVTGGRKTERGSVMAVSAFGMLTFLLAVGLCVDISHFYVVKAELQNAADASALAGASALNSSPSGITLAANRAVEVMNSYEFGNEGVTINPENVLFSKNFGGPYVGAGEAQGQASDIRFVSVQVPAKEIGVFFADVATGSRTENISAEAVAGMSMPPNTFCDWIPLSVIDDPNAPTLVPGQEYTIRGGPQGSVSPGNRQVLAIGGSGASVVRENLARGIRQCARPGDVYTKDTKPGVNAGPARDGLNTRFDDYSAGMSPADFPPDVNVKENITWDQYREALEVGPSSPNWNSPSPGHVGVPMRRVVILPIIDINEFDEGRDTVRFWKFVAFFLKARVPGGSGGDITAEYIGERFMFGSGGYTPGGGPVTPELAQPVLYR